MIFVFLIVKVVSIAGGNCLDKNLPFLFVFLISVPIWRRNNESFPNLQNIISLVSDSCEAAIRGGPKRHIFYLTMESELSSIS